MKRFWASFAPIFLFCLFAAAVGAGTVSAKKDAHSSALSQADSAGDSSSSGSPSRLQGGVKGAALLTRDGLVKLGQTNRDLKQASLLLIGEVTRKELVQVRGANVLPNGVVIQPMPMPSGLAEAGPLPPRKRQLALFMKTIDFNVHLLRNETDALIIPENRATEIAAPWQLVQKSIAQIEVHLAQLKLLTAGPKYDSLKIGKEAVAIHDLVESVEKARKQVVSILGQQ